ncbi:hypothetical protein EV683_103163 [Crenobacter luteus]|uniref:Uncharacterized protein n=1 Tax=Crenobacter luteus TaxID=1452487 RepID=A0A163CMU5_9NEIS|nr:hypothetical protein [Crenobacter luteus]KZE32816.1 hypothetical protein AVW16_10545 [Crenobacter luteus]TCP14899.1 hypothetical protein EV683_103163 [Crenobacter luteus]
MKRFTMGMLLLGLPCWGWAAGGMEFRFTPFRGDEAGSARVDVVPGVARIFLNDALHAVQALKKRPAPVDADEREVAPAVQLSLDAFASRLRRGENTLRIEFVPAEPKRRYRAQFGWRVQDAATGAGRFGVVTSSQSGWQTRDATGTLRFESRFETATLDADGLTVAPSLDGEASVTPGRSSAHDGTVGAGMGGMRPPVARPAIDPSLGPGVFSIGR